MACHNAHVLLLLFVVIASAWCMIDAQVTLPIPGSDTSIGQMEQTVQSDPESEAMDPLVALWKKAKKLGMCIFEKQLVHCSKDYSYGR